MPGWSNSSAKSRGPRSAAAASSDGLSLNLLVGRDPSRQRELDPLFVDVLGVIGVKAVRMTNDDFARD
jgi:hypothetical protein